MRMVPAETQQARTDSLPKPQSVTQLDGSVTMASTNGQEENESIGHTSVTVPEVLTASDCQESVQSSEAQVCDGEMPPVPELSQPCVSLAELASTELLLLDVEEALIGEEFAFPFPDHVSSLDIQGSAGSDQGVQDTCLSPFSSEQMALRAASSVNHSEAFHTPSISYGESTTVNALADTYLPNNPMVQNPPRHFFSDPYEYELEKLRREEEYLKKSFEETTSKLMAELDREMAEARSKYDRESKELDDAYKAKAKEEEVNRGFVESSSLLANAFVSKCSDRSESSDLAVIRAALITQQLVQQQQQAVQTNTHVSSTAPPRQPLVTTVEALVPNPSGPLSHFPRCTTSQPTPMSQQANTPVASTAPPRPLVTTVEAPIPNPSGPLSHFPSCTTTQPTPMSQQANTPVDSTAPPRPLVTAEKAPIPNPSGPLSHSPSCTTTQPTPLSQQANTPVASTAPPRPSVTAAAPPISNPLSRFPCRNTSPPRPSSQQPAVQSNTPINSTAPPRPSVTAAAPPTSDPLSRFPCRNTSPPRPLSQQPAVQSNTPINSTAPPRPSVTATEPLVPLARFQRRHTSQPRPMSQQPVVQSDTHMNSTAPPPPPVTAVELPTPSHLRPLSHSPRSTTTQPSPISQSNTNVNPTALARTAVTVTSEAIPLHTPRTDTPRPRPPPVISNVTPSSSQPVYGRVRGPAPHLKPFRSSPAPNSAAAATTPPTRLVQEQGQGTRLVQEQRQGNSKGGLVYLSDDEE